MAFSRWCSFYYREVPNMCGMVVRKVRIVLNRKRICLCPRTCCGMKNGLHITGTWPGISMLEALLLLLLLSPAVVVLPSRFHFLPDWSESSLCYHRSSKALSICTWAWALLYEVYVTITGSKASILSDLGQNSRPHKAIEIHDKATLKTISHQSESLHVYTLYYPILHILRPSNAKKNSICVFLQCSFFWLVFWCILVGLSSNIPFDIFAIQGPSISL